MVCALLLARGTNAWAGAPVAPYPTPGRQAGTTAFFHESGAPHLASAQYPAWFRGGAPDGRADSSSQYFYTQLIGPAGRGAGGDAPGVDAVNLRMGTLVLKPGATYPAHNHPSREIYYVTAGEAEWFVDDEKQHVTAGSIILHRPFAVHGWTNTSTKRPLTVVWIRWMEPGDPPEALDQGAQFLNPDQAKDRDHARPFAVPLPPPHP